MRVAQTVMEFLKIDSVKTAMDTWPTPPMPLKKELLKGIEEELRDRETKLANLPFPVKKYLNGIIVSPTSEEALEYLKECQSNYSTDKMIGELFSGWIKELKFKRVYVSAALRVTMQIPAENTFVEDFNGRHFRVEIEVADLPTIAPPVTGCGDHQKRATEARTDGTPDPIKAVLIIDEGNGEQTEYVSQLPCIIGREAPADVVLKSGLVSRRHLEISSDSDGSIVIRDISSNGTFINGKDLVGSTSIVKPGSEITVELGYGREKSGSDIRPHHIKANMDSARRKDFPRIIIRSLETAPVSTGAYATGGSTPPPVTRWK